MSLVEIPSLLRLAALEAAPQRRPAPLDELLGLFATPALATLSGPPELASLVAYCLGIHAASGGRQVTLRDLRENITISRTLEAIGRVNGLTSGKRIVPDRDPVVLDAYADNGIARRRFIAQLKVNRPDLVVIDALQNAMAGPAALKPGYDPEGAAWSLLQIVEALRACVLVLTGLERTIVDDAADIRLHASLAGPIVTLSAAYAAAGEHPGPVQFQLLRVGDYAGLQVINPLT